MIGIYKITNKINGKSYIGQSINIEKRVREHFWKSTCSKDPSFNSILHSAVRKYGQENFSWEVLSQCNYSELDSLEQYYINKYDTITPNGYNILAGGQKIRTVPVFCSSCGVQITKGSKTGKCVRCSQIAQRKVVRPPIEVLVEEIKSSGYSSVGRKYGVSGNSIKKWVNMRD